MNTPSLFPPLNVNLYSDEQLRAIVFRCTRLGSQNPVLQREIDSYRDQAACELDERARFELTRRAA